MGGYSWAPKFTIKTVSASDTYWTPGTDMSGVKGQIETMGPNYKPERIVRETVEYERRDIIVGWRVTFGFTFFIDGSMTDHSGMATVVSAFGDLTKTVELDPNPSVTNHSSKRVLLDKYSMKAVAGKTFAGAEFYLEVSTADLVSTVPAIGSGLAW
jgi:hypothetical protein